jgi:hypothetical protein
MVQQVGVRAPDPARDGLQCDCRRPIAEQQLARRFERGGTAFFRAEATTSY